MSTKVPMDSPPNIAIAHDWLVARRGGEAVLNAIAEALQPHGVLGPLFTMFDSGVRLGDPVDSLSRETSLLQRIPGSDRLRRWLLPAYHAAVAELSQRLEREHRERGIDLVVSTSSAAMLGLWPPTGVPHLCYLHTPARYIWNQTDAYAGASGLQAFGLGLFGPALKDLDREASRSVTTFVANSTHTASLARECYGRDALVIHPPVRTEFFTPAPIPREEFWLAAGALEPYKRFDLAIEAARIAGRELVIVGKGTCLDALRRQAGPGVRFITNASDEVLRALMRRARLLIFPQVEDFGIIAVEAQACGLPVLARRAGGALDTVLDGTTGRFFVDDNPEALAFAADHCPEPDAPEIRAHAEGFGHARFAEQFAGVALGLIRKPR